MNVAARLRADLGVELSGGPRERTAWRIDEDLARRFPARPLLVGQAPGSSGDWPCFFGGRAGNRLAELAALPWTRFVRACERVNLVQRYPGRTGGRGGGDAWPAREARDNALRLLPYLLGRRVLVVGSAVADALGLGRHTWLEVREYGVERETREVRTGDLLAAAGSVAAGQAATSAGAAAGGALARWLYTGTEYVFIAAVFPHPSGLNRYWNDPDAAERAKAFLRALLGHEGRRST